MLPLLSDFHRFIALSERERSINHKFLISILTNLPGNYHRRYLPVALLRAMTGIAEPTIPVPNQQGRPVFGQEAFPCKNE